MYRIKWRNSFDLLDCANSNMNINGVHSSPDMCGNQDCSNCLSNSGDVCEDTECPQNSSSACSLERNEGIVDANGTSKWVSLRESQMAIDLNKPPLSSDFPNELTGIEQNNDNVSVNNSYSVYEIGGAQSFDGGATRRQSTRIRPSATKALEALEMGFFSTRKRKAGVLSWRTNSKSRSSQQVHRGVDDKISEVGAEYIVQDTENRVSPGY